MLSLVHLEALHGENLCLANADLSGAILHRAQLISCDFQNAGLNKTDLSEATLRSCVLNNVRANGSRCQSAVFEHSLLQGADFSHAHLVGARLSASSWARAYMAQAILDGAEGDAVVFRGADLMDASLIGAQLPGADFRGADLSGADLSDGDFFAADFRGAILDDVRWLGAVYKDARFDSDRPHAKKLTSISASVPAPDQDDFAPGTDKQPYMNTDAVSVVMSQLISLISAGDLKAGAADSRRSQQKNPARDGSEAMSIKNTVDLIMSLDKVPKPGSTTKTPRYPAGATLSATLRQLFPDITEPNEAALETLVSTMAAVLDKSKKDRGPNDDHNPEQ
jgi:uncharacterized protein YjbI with pentapeptide repeats